MLSTTAKAKAKAQLKQASSGGAAAARDAVDKDAAKDKDDDTEMTDASKDGVDKKDEKKKEEDKKESEPEPETFVLSNPSRVTYAQHAFVTPDPANRYRPVHTKQKRNLGVMVLTDSTPDEVDDELVDIEAPPKAGEDRVRGLTVSHVAAAPDEGSVH